ncbi:MAG TPA: helix-turn-helix transcriptional regulator [Bacteroidales bacterium]|nr:helix-turn-helix transcriptional regulator [Bacteroidales bacterium]
MSRIDELKAEIINRDPESKRRFDEYSIRLKTAVMILEIRDQHNLSQSELAEKVGVKKSTIARIENASINTSVQMLDRIAKAVDKELKIEII